ncbi:MAG: PAS domain-containing protein [Chloroflexota bacterium]
MNKRTNSFGRILGILTSPNAFSFYTVFLMWAVCTLFYYFGELVEFAGWKALSWPFLYGVHDVHRLLFLAPIIYAAYVFGIKATVIITIISFMTFLPRALFISPFPDPLVRIVVFTLVAGIVSCLIAALRKRNRVESILTTERDSLLKILESMPDGVLITGPDYRIRYMNASMIRDFGAGIGAYCYKCLQGLDGPCHQICRLPAVLRGEIQSWKYSLPDGTIYEVSASPYRDIDGVVCQLGIFRKIIRSKPTGGDAETKG